MIVLRHCQSEFNQHFSRTGRDPGIVDPDLTALGREQAERAASLLCAPGATPIRRLLVSPYTRTLQTAAPIARRLGLVPEIVVLARERYAFSCDIGSAPASLVPAWPGIDFSGLQEVWWHEGGHGDLKPRAMEHEEAVLARADAFRTWVAEDPRHENTLLVSHWGFLLALTGHAFENGEFRLFDPA